MKKNSFNQVFLEMLQDIYDAENQIIKALPLMIKAAAYDDLKEAFDKHLKETKDQVERLNQVFKLLGETPKSKKCHGIEGLIEEGKEIMQKDLPNAIKDACLIVAAQKIEHYEIATYGSLCTFVNHLAKTEKEKMEFKKIGNLLEDTLNEEEKTDLTLTKIAEGTTFLEGINEVAEKEVKAEML